MKSSRVSRSIAGATLLAGTLAALGGAIGGRRTPEPRPASKPLPVQAAPPPVPTPAIDVVTSLPVKKPLPSVGPLAEFPSGAARTEAASLLASAVDARGRGDLRTTLRLLQTAVERAPTVETHAALGGLYLELAVAGAATTHLRAAAEADPQTADRWIALANALALKPDPVAAAEALERAQAAEPGLRVARGTGGWLVREPSLPTP